MLASPRGRAAAAANPEFPRSLNPNTPPPPRLAPPSLPARPPSRGGGGRGRGRGEFRITAFALRSSDRHIPEIPAPGRKIRKTPGREAPPPPSRGPLRCRGRWRGFGLRRRRVGGEGWVPRSGRRRSTPAGRRRSGSAADQPAWPRSATRRSPNPPLPEPEPASASSSSPPSLPARPPAPRGRGAGAGGAGRRTASPTAPPPPPPPPPPPRPPPAVATAGRGGRVDWVGFPGPAGPG
jgi:hypothetical protein